MSLVAQAGESEWLLSTRSTSYGITLGTLGAPGQVYWGERLETDDFKQLLSTRRDKWVSTFERPAEADEELPVDGGHRWGRPSLQVRYPAGVRAVELDQVGSTITETGLVLHLEDGRFGLKVDLHYSIHFEHDVIERWVDISNDGPNAVSVLRADSARWAIPELSSYTASSVRGHWGGEFQLSREKVPYGDWKIGSRLGVTGHTTNPWMSVDDGSATESSGEVWSIALAWSGSWQLTAQHRPEGSLSVSAGMGQDGLELELDPGQQLRTPSSFGLFSPAGLGGSSRAWHAFTRDKITPHSDEVRPVMYNSWEATHFDVDVHSQIDLAQRAHRIGVELFVVDDGWFSKRNSDSSGLGDWTADTTKFPAGLRPLSDEVHALGMKFGLWVEPEMVNPDSELFRNHPDWTYHWKERTPTVVRNQLVLNFARRDVRAWALDWLNSLVSTNQIDFLKWDMNRPLTEAGWPDDPSRTDWVWMEHVLGVYKVIDDLRSRHPELRVEACSSGGGRVDLGILSRADQVWPSDNTDALDRQVIQHGYSQAYPASTMSCWVTDAANLLTERFVPMEYRFHVAMAGVLGIGADIATWSDSDIDQAAEYVRLYKSIRSTVQRGEQYRLLGRPGLDRSAIQYVGKGQVVLLSYEPHRSLSNSPRRVRLAGLDPNARYQLAGQSNALSGRYLMAVGLPFNAHLNDRGWDNLKFSNRDYLSSVVILTELKSEVSEPE